MSRDTGELINGIDPVYGDAAAIPAGIMQAAEAACRQVADYIFADGWEQVIEATARALLAERQRAAAIAETMAPVELSRWSSSASPKKVWRHSAILQSERIANAILAQGDKP